MSDCKPVQTPLLPPKLALSHSMSPSTQEEQDAMNDIPYLSAVGSLQYLAMMTRPDIAHSVAASMPILVQNTGKPSNTSSVMSKALLITSSPTKANWAAMSCLSPTLILLMVIVLTLDDPLLGM